jgi:hypothetical protein
MPKHDRSRLATLRAELLDHPMWTVRYSDPGDCSRES